MEYFSENEHYLHFATMTDKNKNIQGENQIVKRISCSVQSANLKADNNSLLS